MLARVQTALEQEAFEQQQLDKKEAKLDRRLAAYEQPVANRGNFRDRGFIADESAVPICRDFAR